MNWVPSYESVVLPGLVNSASTRSSAPDVQATFVNVKAETLDTEVSSAPPGPTNNLNLIGTVWPPLMVFQMLALGGTAPPEVTRLFGIPTGSKNPVALHPVIVSTPGGAPTL